MASQAGLLKNAGTPFVEIHPDDAAARGIADGDEVVLGNGARRVPLAGRRDGRGAARRRRLAEGALGETVGRAERQLADDGRARRHRGAGELPQLAGLGPAGE